jgi:signal transduction histidine kinase
LAEAGLIEMRSLIFELRPETLENEGLIAALARHAQAIQARHGISVITELCDEPSVSLETKQALYRIAREALHNTIKHAIMALASIRTGHFRGTLACNRCASARQTSAVQSRSKVCPVWVREFS